MGWTQVTNPQPGDVCTSDGHCGIYIGNGQMIHAADYGTGVVIGKVQDGMIFVSPN
jgi:cell wall-associated NlpC family hydrolase